VCAVQGDCLSPRFDEGGMSLLHRLRHLIRCTPGEVVSTRAGNGGVLWIGYRCTICGRVTSKLPTEEIPFLTDPTPPDKAFRP